jgi:hypothetical protein
MKDKEQSQVQRLENTLLALQKTFSRLNRETAKVSADNARATLVGNVNFEITLKVNQEGDYLNVEKDGMIDLHLSGQIDPDIREEDLDS